MAHLDYFLLGLLTLVVVSAAPSVSTTDNRPALDTADTETESHLVEALSDTNEQNEPSPRQKRWFNSYGLGFPPMNPIVYPNQYRGDPAPYAPPDPFQQIHNRIRDLTAQINDFRPPFTYFPVLFIPQFINCGCSSAKPTPQPNNDSLPDTGTRFSDKDDPRTNWGFVRNNTVVDNTDYSRRPIDLVPYEPDVPLSRPAPPVEHGSSQAGLGGAEGAAAQAPPARPPSAQAPPERDFTTQAPKTPPTSCDTATLICCHKAQVTYDCFSQQGCQDPAAYGNPCDPQVILRVVSRFQSFYGRTTD